MGAHMLRERRRRRKVHLDRTLAFRAKNSMRNLLLEEEFLVLGLQRRAMVAYQLVRAVEVRIYDERACTRDTCLSSSFIPQQTLTVLPEIGSFFENKLNLLMY